MTTPATATHVPCELVYPDAECVVPGELWTFAPASDVCPVCLEDVTGPGVVVDSAPMTTETLHLACVIACANTGTLTLVVGEAAIPDTGRHHERVA